MCCVHYWCVDAALTSLAPIACVTLSQCFFSAATNAARSAEDSRPDESCRIQMRRWEWRSENRHCLPRALIAFFTLVPLGREHAIYEHFAFFCLSFLVFFFFPPAWKHSEEFSLWPWHLKHIHLFLFIYFFWYSCSDQPAVFPQHLPAAALWSSTERCFLFAYGCFIFIWLIKSNAVGAVTDRT